MSIAHKVFICLYTNSQSKEMTLILVIVHEEYKNTLGLHLYSVHIDLEKNWKKKTDRKTMLKEIFEYGILVPCPECINTKEKNRRSVPPLGWKSYKVGTIY